MNRVSGHRHPVCIPFVLQYLEWPLGKKKIARPGLEVLLTQIVDNYPISFHHFPQSWLKCEKNKDLCFF